MNNLTKNQKILIAIFVAIAVLLLGYTLWNLYSDNNSENTYEEDLMINSTNTNENKSDPIDVAPEKIVVYIVGSVKKPGIIELNADSRVSDAVELAGGLLEDADTSKINLAFKLEDGQKITIPSVNDKTDKNSTYEDYISNDPGDMISHSSSNSSKNAKVNINSATQTELETLPGIGPSIAAKIISYRNENGKFKTVEDLKNVSGIGDSKFNNVKAYICV